MDEHVDPSDGGVEEPTPQLVRDVVAVRVDADHSVIDEDVRLLGSRRVHVCDMSVMRLASSANPLRTLAALALRLSAHWG